MPNVPLPPPLVPMPMTISSPIFANYGPLPSMSVFAGNLCATVSTYSNADTAYANFAPMASVEAMPNLLQSGTVGSSPDQYDYNSAQSNNQYAGFEEIHYVPIDDEHGTVNEGASTSTGDILHH